MRIESIEWDDRNRAHATLRATEDQINQAIRNAHRIARNVKGHSATHLVYGPTDGGQPLVVAVLYSPKTRTARPITAWEDR